jgi:hypothetical protein
MHSLSHGQPLLPCNQECPDAFSLVQTAIRRRLLSSVDQLLHDLFSPNPYSALLSA